MPDFRPDRSNQHVMMPPPLRCYGLGGAGSDTTIIVLSMSCARFQRRAPLSSHPASPPSSHATRAPSRRLRMIAALLMGTVFLTTVLVSSAAGLLGERWQRWSTRVFDEVGITHQRVQSFARTYPAMFIPVRLISSYKRNRANATTTTPSNPFPMDQRQALRLS